LSGKVTVTSRDDPAGLVTPLPEEPEPELEPEPDPELVPEPEPELEPEPDPVPEVVPGPEKHP
jgi:hypothetical protein